MIYEGMLRREEFESWLNASGYCTMNDWNFQEIGPFTYYFIKNPDTGKYALIKQHFGQDRYEVLLQDWTDYNGWNM